MALLNITYNGRSADYDLAVDHQTTDHEIRRIAIELVRSGSIRGLHVPNLAANAFDTFVVDRVGAGRNEKRIYLRPKVPFGCC